MKSIKYPAYKTISSSVHIPSIQKPTLLSLLEAPRVFNGFMHGRRQPAGCAMLQVFSFHESQVQSLGQAFQYYFGAYSDKFSSIYAAKNLVAYLGECICILQRMSGLPIFDTVQIDVISDSDNIYQLWVPLLHEECFHQSMAFMLQFIAHHIASESVLSAQKNISDEINTLIEKLKSHSPKGSNSLRLLETAYQEEIPWIHLAQNVFQFGYGRHSRWFDSSFTDTTSKIAADLVKDKYSTHKFLKMAGLPVAQQHIAVSESDAIELANKIGYPVVIKPHNQDGGKGVFARLNSDSQVKNAFNQARQYSETVLLEKHVIGRDYRLLVLNGEIIWAIERIPAGVTGDGVHTISELIQIENQHPDRSNKTNFRLKRIEINEDVIEYLADQGYTLNSIIKHGEFIAVNRIANISSGGTPVSVFNKIHPDNKRLIENAATLSRLDIAGIDFITPDIEHSYLEKGGSIIEINAQPQFGILTTPHIYKQVLSALLPNQGRIPVIVICSDNSEDALIQKLNLDFAKDNKNIGLIRDNAAYLNNERISQSSSNFTAARTVLLNKNMDALIYVINHWEDVADQGLPFDQYDCLYLLGLPKSKNGITHEFYASIINTLFLACRSRPIIAEAVVNILAKCGIEAGQE